MRRLVVAAVLVLAGCAQPLQGIDLPPASLPDEIDSAQWAVAFSHEFGPDFWAQGPHVYQLLLDCPAAGQAQVTSELVFFRAGSEFPSLDQQIHLRLTGLSTSRLGAPNLQYVSTAQETTALVTVIGLSEEQVEAAGDCVGEVQWDDGKSAPLLPDEPFRP